VTHAVLTVEDWGIGIPAADIPLVFHRFHRGANVVGRIAGSGLGLAGARQIVEMHGGLISVQSEVGVGTTFTVSLPLDPVLDCIAATRDGPVGSTAEAARAQ
jgi:two-component system phosphate regulon sensor histidine kinase PhoR